jgi:cobalt-zinc-cadmium efflux system outer membrane protein
MCMEAKRWHLTVILVLFLLCGSAQGQILSIDTVVAIIEQNNPGLNQYDTRVRAFDEYARGATSWMAPMVGVGTFMTPYNRERAMHENEKGAWMFSVEQEIPNPAKLNASRDMLQSKADIEKQTKALVYNELRAEAKMLYYQWLIDEKKATILKNNTELMELLLKLARIRHRYNQGTLGNIYQAEGRIAEVENMLLETEASIEDKRARLIALMGISPESPIMIDTATDIQFTLATVVEDTASLRERRSDVRQIEESIEVMRLNQQLQRSMAKPDFKIRFDHMNAIGDMPNQFSAMAMISIPIAPWSSKSYKSEVKGMQYEIDAMKRNQEAILVATRGALNSLVKKIERTQQQLDRYETKVIPALSKNYQTLVIAYEENREQLPMVIDGWEAMNMAQLDYLDKLNEYYMMIVAYEKELER